MKTVCALLFATLMVMLFPLTALADLAAGTPLFSWTNPTQSIDGTTIPSTGQNALATAKFYCDGVSTAKVALAAPVSSWQTTPGTFSVGAHSCQIAWTNVGGNEAAKSNTVPFVVPPPLTTPKAVNDLGVQ